MVEWSEVVRALIRGESLMNLGLPVEDGRVVIKGLDFSSRSFAEVALKFNARFDINQFLYNQEWRGITFKQCVLSGLKLENAHIGNCIFERCKLRDVGVWKSQFAGCEFIRCDMRGMALGGHDEGAATCSNEFLHIVFQNCDLRNSAHSAELYEDCVFSDCKFDRVDLLGARFVNCVFKGVVDDAIFRKNYKFCHDAPDNLLEGCDFREANVIYCKFMHIDLRREMFSPTADIVFLPRGKADLELWKARIGRSNLVLDSMIKHAGAGAVMSGELLRQVFSSEEIQALEEIVGSAPSEEQVAN